MSKYCPSAVIGLLAILKAPAPKPRLLVLPFANLSGDPGQEYTRDAVTEDMIAELARMAPDGLAVTRSAPIRDTQHYFAG